METLNKEAVKILHLLGKNDVTSVSTTIGPEQEYFLVDKALYEKRKDLIFTGRTLLGAMPPKGQEMEDHYFGALKPVYPLTCMIWMKNSGSWASRPRQNIMK